jgi:hypothetical protein
VAGCLPCREEFPALNPDIFIKTKVSTPHLQDVIPASAMACSHRDIVCLLIQSNCIELQTSINIFIWIA